MVGGKSRLVLRLFLRLYYFVIPYVVVVSLSMVNLYYLGLLLSFYYIMLTIYVPIGPLPLGLLPNYFFPYLNSVIQDFLGNSNGVIIAGIIVLALLILKILVLALSKNKYVFRVRLLYLELIIIIIGIVELIEYYFLEHYMLKTVIETLILYTYWLIGETLPIDIVLLSYTVYRDAVTRMNETTIKYLVAITILWLSVLWLGIFPNPRILPSILQPQQNPSTAIMFTIWIIVTIVEPLLHSTKISRWRDRRIVK